MWAQGKCFLSCLSICLEQWNVPSEHLKHLAVVLSNPSADIPFGCPSGNCVPTLTLMLIWNYILQNFLKHTKITEKHLCFWGLPWDLFFLWIKIGGMWQISSWSSALSALARGSSPGSWDACATLAPGYPGPPNSTRSLRLQQRGRWSMQTLAIACFHYPQGMPLRCQSCSLDSCI